MRAMNRRELIGSLAAGAVLNVVGCHDREASPVQTAMPQGTSLALPNGDIDWRASELSQTYLRVQVLSCRPNFGSIGSRCD